MFLLLVILQVSSFSLHFNSYYDFHRSCVPFSIIVKYMVANLKFQACVLLDVLQLWIQAHPFLPVQLYYEFLPHIIIIYLQEKNFPLPLFIIQQSVRSSPSLALVFRQLLLKSTMPLEQKDL